MSLNIKRRDYDDWFMQLPNTVIEHTLNLKGQLVFFYVYKIDIYREPIHSFTAVDSIDYMPLYLSYSDSFKIYRSKTKTYAKFSKSKRCD